MASKNVDAAPEKKALNTRDLFVEARGKFSPESVQHLNLWKEDGTYNWESNIMSRIVAGTFGPGYQPRFYEQCVVLQNRADNNAHWQSEDPAWVGKASMSKLHFFVVPPLDLEAKWEQMFNVVSLPNTPETIQMLERMQKAAVGYVKSEHPDVNVDNLEMFFHCYPHNSLGLLHMHVIDRSQVGPSYIAQSHKNLSVSEIIQGLLLTKSLL